MAINYTNKDDLVQFVADNFAEINRGIKQFKINPNNNLKCNTFLVCGIRLIL